MTKITSISQYSLLFFLVFSINIFSNDSKTISELLEKATILENQNNYEKAIVIYNQALKIASENFLSTDASYIYKKIGDSYYDLKKYNFAKTYFKKSIQKNSLSKHLAPTHFNLALVFRKQKNIDSLLFHIQKSLDCYENLEDSEIKFNTYLKSGILLKNNGNYDLAISYLIKAYEGFDNLNNNSKKASVSNTIGSIQRLQGNFDIAKKYYLEALTLRKQLGDSVKLSYGYNNLANILNTQKKYDSAIIYYKKAIHIQEALNKKEELGKYYYNLGTIYFTQKKLNKAATNYKKSIRIKKSNYDLLSITNQYNELAAIYLKKNNSFLTKKYLDSANLYLNSNQNKDVLLRHYDLQSQYHKKINDYQTSLKFREQHNLLYKSLFKQKQTKIIQELQERFESKQKNQKIKHLVKGDKIQKAVISNQKKDLKLKNLILIVCVVLLILVTVVYFLFKEKQKLKEKNLELFRLKSIFKSQEAIKEKISKDLHDIVTTRYDGIRLKIEALPNVKNPVIVSEKIVKEIAEINEEIRLISHRISPLGTKPLWTTSP